MAVSTWSQQRIEEMIAESGDQCRYCHVRVRKNFVGHDRADNDATIDHIIPRSKNGTNALENLTLACARCNHAKGDRDLADFLADPRPFSERKPQRRHVSRGVTYVRERDDPKFAKGTMAHAIATGEVTPSMSYRRAPNDLPRSGVRIPKPKMTAAETAALLRKGGERKTAKGIPIIYPDDPQMQKALEHAYRGRGWLLRVEE